MQQSMGLQRVRHDSVTEPHSIIMDSVLQLACSYDPSIMLGIKFKECINALTNR